MLDRKILVPFNAAESITPNEAAELAGVHLNTIYNWCAVYGIGRRVACRWHISRIALAMHLEGDEAALVLYHSGERELEPVAAYFARFGMHSQRLQCSQFPQTTLRRA